MADSWNKKEDNVDERGINLLPEDLRQREEQILKNAGPAAPEMRIPQREKLEKHEGKVPWFSWSSWFKREKTPVTETTEPKTEKPKKPRLIFRILKDRRREQEELEAAKAEVLKKTIMEDVFKKSSADLPANNNELFNAEKATRLQGASPVQLPDMFDQAKVSTQPIVTETPKPVVPEVPATSMDAPLPVPPVERETVLQPVSVPVSAPASAEVEPEHRVAPPMEEKPHQPFHWPTVFSHKENGGLKNFDVNLIPTSLTLRNWKSISHITIWAVMVTLILCALSYSGLWWWGERLQNQRSTLDDQITEVQAKILKFESLRDQLASTETNIKDMQQLVNQHVYWTQFFAALEKFTLANVYFDGLTAGINGNMSFSAHAPDYLTAAKQVKLLQQPEAHEFVISASATHMSKNSSGGVDFSLELMINPDLYYKIMNSNEQ